ncbi:MAG: hypothetical protein L3J54_13680, partial [Draconibacterium sp.]|nr:hypothetical protein [Draconibacterium sp.]
MEIKYGNVFDFGQLENGIIIHGANCFSTMGAGIALQVKKFYPEAYQADFNDTRTPEEKLGHFTYFDYNDFIIVNAYTQYEPGANANYEAIENSL